MSQEVVIFSFQSMNIRTLTIEGEVFLRASDVADVLDMRTSALLQRLPDDEVISNDLIDSMGRSQATKFLSEAGVYRAVLRSDKKEAEPFIRWVTREVLPSIRKQGFYMSEKLKIEIEAKDAELARKEAVILKLQSKKQHRYLVPSDDHLDGFDPPLVMRNACEVTEEQKREANTRHNAKIVAGILKRTLEDNGIKATFDAFYGVFRKILPE